MTELFACWVSFVARLHSGLLAFLPDWLVLACWSLPMAWLVMALYRRFSSQAALLVLAQEMADLQKQMLSLRTSTEDASAATRQYLELSWRRLRLTLVPVLLSSLPVWPLWAGLSAFYANAPYVLEMGPVWMRHWLFVFCFFSVACTVTLKIAWRLK